tara:strand:+ start:644 stop:895 length:252 start_codon:yes stop_codon:yes gene_type:complete
MKYTENDKSMLARVDEIGMEINSMPEENIIFVVLSPYLDNLMALLKKLSTDEIGEVFFKYKGVMKVMRLIEDSAQKMEKEFSS